MFAFERFSRESPGKGEFHFIQNNDNQFPQIWIFTLISVSFSKILVPGDGNEHPLILGGGGGGFTSFPNNYSAYANTIKCRWLGFLLDNVREVPDYETRSELFDAHSDEKRV